MHMPELFRTIQDFSQNKLLIDWEQVWADEEYQRTVLEAIHMIQQGLALLRDGQQEKRINFIGKLSFLASHLDFATIISNDEQRFLTIAQEIEGVLKEIITYEPWLLQAQERYSAFIEYTERQSVSPDKEADPEKMLYFQAPLLAVAFESLISFDQADEHEDFDFDQECLSDNCDDEDAGA